MFLQTLFSVFIIVCSVDLWILAIVAWSSTHHQTSMPCSMPSSSLSRYPTACLTSYSMQIYGK